MLFSLLQSMQAQDGSFRYTLIVFLLSLPVILFSLSAHESAHGLVAYWSGDPTAHNLGRISLNPTKHFDPFGFICMLLFGFGWAKPVPINTRNLKKAKIGMAVTAAAGPITNFLIGIACTFMTALSFTGFCVSVGIPTNTPFALYSLVNEAPFYCYLLMTLYYFFYIASIMNFTLAFFNLIPIPPFDGSRIVTVFLPTNLYFRIMKYERQIMLGFLLLLFVLSRFFEISLTSWLSEQLFEILFTPFRRLFAVMFA